MEIGVPQFAGPFEQPHSDEEEAIGKKRTTQPDMALGYGTAEVANTQA